MRRDKDTETHENTDLDTYLYLKSRPILPATTTISQQERYRSSYRGVHKEDNLSNQGRSMYGRGRRLQDAHNNISIKLDGK